MRKCQTACKPGSVPGLPLKGVVPWMTIPLGRSSPNASRDQPGQRRGNALVRNRLHDPDRPPLFGLAPGGVYRAIAVAGDAVRSYRTLSPLPGGRLQRPGGLLSVALSLGSPPPGVTRHRVSVEPGLSSPRQGRGAAI